MDLWTGLNTAIKKTWPQIKTAIVKFNRVVEKGINWIFWSIKRLYRYLKVYENRERVIKYTGWTFILIIIIVPFFIHQIEFPIGVKNTTDIDYIPVVPIVEEDEEVTSNKVLEKCYDYIKHNVNDRYTIYKVVKRTNTVRITLYSDNWYDYNELRNIGKYMKTTYPELYFTIIYVRSYDTTHTVVDYQI